MTSTEHNDISRHTGMALRTSLQVALQVAEQLARRREQRRRAAAADNEQRARALQTRIDAERKSVDARLHSARRDSWWQSATDAQISDTARLAHTWKSESRVADDITRDLPDRLRRHRNIDLSLPDIAETAVVAAVIERDLADRAESERLLERYAERGHKVLSEPPLGTDYVPLRALATEPDAKPRTAGVDPSTHPQAWVVHVGMDFRGQPDPQFYCTDLDAAGVHRRPAVLADIWDEQWIASATEPQLRELRQVVAANSSMGNKSVVQFDEQIRESRGINLKRAPDQIGRDIETALPWAEKNIPADAARYKDGDAKTKAMSAKHIKTSFDTHHAQQWANSQAPALAVDYGAAAASSDRETYLAVRGRMIEEWNTAGRPAVETDPSAPSPSQTAPGEPGYDTPQRRQRDVDALTAAGVDAETIDAHMLGDIATAAPLDAAATQQPATAPAASKGVHSPQTERSADRGSR